VTRPRLGRDRPRGLARDRHADVTARPAAAYGPRRAIRFTGLGFPKRGLTFLPDRDWQEDADQIVAATSGPLPLGTG
jgi:hypothetical protein